MSQIIHIFRKDVRHHWLEIILSLASLILYCWQEARHWSHEADRASFWQIALGVLLPLTWWILILRVVQDESLVGDRQFWVTRPYEWKKLLAAKFLFVFLFINLPVIIAGLVLLKLAGFHAFRYLPGLLWMQVLLIQLPLLPMAAIASVTRNITHALLAVLAVALYMAGMLGLAVELPEPTFSSELEWVQGGLVVVTCIAVVWSQYAYRRTLRACIWLASAAAVIALTMVTSSYFGRGLDPYQYPSSDRQSLFRTVLDPAKPEVATNPPAEGYAVRFSMPLVTPGLTKDDLAHIIGVRIALEAPDRFHWQTSWESRFELLRPGANRWDYSFEMPYKIFQRMKSVPVKARISVATSIFRDENPIRVVAEGREFAVTGVGRCRLDTKSPGQVHCHSPLVKPSMVMVSSDPEKSTCTSKQTVWQVSKPGMLAYSWESGGDSWAEYGVSPIESFSFYFSAAPVCPGTPLTFSFPEFVEHIRTDFEISPFTLEDYRRDNVFDFTISFDQRHQR